MVSACVDSVHGYFLYLGLLVLICVLGLHTMWDLATELLLYDALPDLDALNDGAKLRRRFLCKDLGLDC